MIFRGPLLVDLAETGYIHLNMGNNKYLYPYYCGLKGYGLGGLIPKTQQITHATIQFQIIALLSYSHNHRIGLRFLSRKTPSFDMF